MTKIGILVWCFFLGGVCLAQTSAYPWAVNDTTQAVWHDRSGFVVDTMPLTVMAAIETDIQEDNLLIANSLFGFQYQQYGKHYSLIVAPYFFSTLTLDSNNIPAFDERIGRLKRQSNMASYKMDMLLQMQWQPISYVHLGLGRGRQQLGRGINSLLWSGNGTPMWYANAALETKKISYRVQWNAVPVSALDNIKWIANHTVTVHLPKQWEISLFEAVVWGAKDSSYNRGFDWSYMAPTVIYRPTEYNGGSADNVLLGLDWSGQLHRKLFTYGQVVVDEFLLDEIRKNDGWWANKFGGQIGLWWKNKKNLIQTEINVVRPFTYSHGNTVIAYTNQVAPIGAWRGAGFAEGVAIFKRAISKSMNIGAMASIGTYKTNGTANYGNNPFVSYESRAGERNHTIGGEHSEYHGVFSVSYSYCFVPKTSYMASVWAGVEINDAGKNYSPWIQFKLSNTLFSNFRKNRF